MGRWPNGQRVGLQIERPGSTLLSQFLAGEFLLPKLPEPAGFGWGVAKQHDLSLRCHTDMTTSEYSWVLGLYFDWIIRIGNYSGASTKICHKAWLLYFSRMPAMSSPLHCLGWCALVEFSVPILCSTSWATISQALQRHENQALVQPTEFEKSHSCAVR